MKDLYSVLGIDVNASPTDIREAYRKLSKKFHPDLNENDPYFENRFKEIREAYELLSDPIGRAAYDNQLKKFRGYPIPLAEPQKLVGKSSLNTKINWAFTAMLLMLTSLFAYYIVRSVTHTKKPKVATVSEATTTTLIAHHKKHRHKKAASTQITAVKAPAKSYADTISMRTVKPSISKILTSAVVVAEKSKPIPTVSKPVAQPTTTQPIPMQSTTVVSARPTQTTTAPVSAPKLIQQNPTPAIVAAKTTPVNNDAYIKANATGIVYMRQMNNYNSDVVSVIPGDTRITVLEKGGNFCKISYNNKMGYVPNWTVQFR